MRCKRKFPFIFAINFQRQKRLPVSSGFAHCIIYSLVFRLLLLRRLRGQSSEFELHAVIWAVARCHSVENWAGNTLSTRSCFLSLIPLLQFETVPRPSGAALFRSQQTAVVAAEPGEIIWADLSVIAISQTVSTVYYSKIVSLLQQRHFCLRQLASHYNSFYFDTLSTLSLPLFSNPDSQLVHSLFVHDPLLRKWYISAATQTLSSIYCKLTPKFIYFYALILTSMDLSSPTLAWLSPAH